MFGAVNFSQLGDLSIHQVFSGHVKGAREVIDLLILVQRLVDGFLYWTYAPEECPCTVVVFVSVNLTLLDVAEAIIFKCVAHNLDIAVMQVKIVAAILRLVWPNRDGILVWSEHKKVLFDLAIDCIHIRSCVHHWLDFFCLITYDFASVFALLRCILCRLCQEGWHLWL